MTAVWQARLASSTARATQLFGAAVAILTRPEVSRSLRRLCVVLLALWILASCWRLLWSFFPEAPPLPETRIVNPPSVAATTVSSERVDIDALVAAQLFGKPGETLSEAELAAASGRAPAMSEAEAAVALAGIEDGAPETRLPLVLRGVVASSEAGLGQAVIEHSKLQDLYQVGDELPVSGEVLLAKVLPELVVLDNGGRYEVLRLFEESSLAGQVPVQQTAAVSSSPAATVNTTSESTNNESRSALAARYREQLYSDPESLADVVQVAPVREGDRLIGYRVMPGRAAREFAALGFQPGDVVTAVNGLAFADPTNTVRLYKDMRGATQASFDIQRKGETVSLDVNIGDLRTEDAP